MAYYRNIVPMDLGGKKVLVHIDMRAAIALSSKYGKFATKKVHESAMGGDVSVLIFALVFALQKHQPNEYTFDSIMEMDPQPAIEIIEEVIFETLMAFQYGAAGPVETNPMKRLWNWILMTRLIQYFRRKD